MKWLKKLFGFYNGCCFCDKEDGDVKRIEIYRVYDVDAYFYHENCIKDVLEKGKDVYGRGKVSQAIQIVDVLERRKNSDDSRLDIRERALAIYKRLTEDNS